MKWLVITSDKERESNVLKSIDVTFSNSTIYFFHPNSFDCSLALEIMPSIDCCVILEKSETSFILFLLGWLVGRNIQTFSLQETTNALVCEAAHFHSFDDSSALKAYLIENRCEIIREVNRRKSWLYLFKKGMSLTVSDFARYIEKEDIDVCTRYMYAGISLDSRDKDGTPLLNIACRNQSAVMVEWLLKNGASVDPVSEDRGYTPLMDAVWKGNLKIASILIERGADVNKMNKEGQTMIILAVGANRSDICRLLVENGADVDFEDGMGMSAYAYARLFKKQDVLAVLEKYHK